MTYWDTNEISKQDTYNINQQRNYLLIKEDEHLNKKALVLLV